MERDASGPSQSAQMIEQSRKPVMIFLQQKYPHTTALCTLRTYTFFFFNLQDGVFIKGLYLQGAGWDKKNSVLSEANPMQLVCQMPTIQFKPVENKKKGSKGRKLSSLFTKQKELMTMYKSRLQHRIYVKIGASEYYETKLCKHTD